MFSKESYNSIGEIWIQSKKKIYRQFKRDQKMDSY